VGSDRYGGSAWTCEAEAVNVGDLYFSEQWSAQHETIEMGIRLTQVAPTGCGLALVFGEGG